jgi:hypothetical protein
MHLCGECGMNSCSGGGCEYCGPHSPKSPYAKIDLNECIKPLTTEEITQKELLKGIVTDKENAILIVNIMELYDHHKYFKQQWDILCSVTPLEYLKEENFRKNTLWSVIKLMSREVACVYDESGHGNVDIDLLNDIRSLINNAD